LRLVLGSEVWLESAFLLFFLFLGLIQSHAFLGFLDLTLIPLQCLLLQDLLGLRVNEVFGLLLILLVHQVHLGLLVLFHFSFSVQAEGLKFGRDPEPILLTHLQLPLFVQPPILGVLRYLFFIGLGKHPNHQDLFYLAEEDQDVPPRKVSLQHFLWDLLGKLQIFLFFSVDVAQNL